MKPNQKLELTWIGKGEEPKLEPRILVEQPEYSCGDPGSGNMLIQGDNLLALKALEQDYAGKVIYMSCYASDVIELHCVPVEFLHKPFTIQGLMEKVESLLLRK
jgi:adenine-specific DNA-methyltransferase